jgi:hypothetical protein
MPLHGVESLSQLLAETFEKRNCSADAATYSWKKYFNSDYTFSLYKFKKKFQDSTTSSSVKNDKKITAGKVRSELLCSMIQLHNALYEDKEYVAYKGQLKCYLLID